jgi:hypothetical protein
MSNLSNFGIKNTVLGSKVFNSLNDGEKKLIWRTGELIRRTTQNTGALGLANPSVPGLTTFINISLDTLTNGAAQFLPSTVYSTFLVGAGLSASIILDVPDSAAGARKIIDLLEITPGFPSISIFMQCADTVNAGSVIGFGTTAVTAPVAATNVIFLNTAGGVGPTGPGSVARLFTSGAFVGESVLIAATFAPGAETITFSWSAA